MTTEQENAGNTKAQAPTPLWRRALFFALMYWALAEMGRHLSPNPGVYVSFWLPAGWFVWTLIVTEFREWPAFALGALVANLAFDLPHGSKLPTALGFFAANLAQSGVGALLVRRFVGPRHGLTQVSHFIGFATFAGAGGTALGALIGSATLVTSGLSNSFVASWKSWWGSTAMAVLLLTPFLLTWFPLRRGGWPGLRSPWRRLEAGALLALMTLYVGRLLIDGPGINAPYKDRMILFILWAGMRFGRRGASGATLWLSALIAYLTTHFARGLSDAAISSGSYIPVMQSFLAITAVVGLVPAIAIEERDGHMAQLSASEERFRHLTQAAFEGICISENGRITDINDQGLKMFGYPREEIIGTRIVELVAPEFRATVMEAVRTGREVAYEHRLLRKDGTTFLAEAQAKMFPIGHRVLRMTALRDVTQQRLAADALGRSREQLRALTLRLQTLREEEATRLSREIHDELGQLLTGLKMDLRWIERDLENFGDRRVNPILDKAVAATELTDTIVKAIQRIASELRPGILDRLGLVMALNYEASQFERRTGIGCRIATPAAEPKLPPEVATAFFRIFQEALTNVARHAGATEVDVIFEVHSGSCVLEIRDNGKGIASEDLLDPNSLGLLGMQERAGQIGGEVAIKPGPAGGSIVRFQVPIPPTPKEAA